MTTTPTAALLGSSRLAICLMSLMAMLIMCLLGNSISLSMVCMARKPQSVDTLPVNCSTGTSRDADVTLPKSDGEDCIGHSVDETTTEFATMNNKFQGEFQWTRSFQGHVLSSYFYGHMISMLPGGWLAGRYGGKHVVGFGLIVSSIASLLLPVAVRFNKYLIVLIRVIMGFALGPVVAAVMTLAGLWFPPHERSFLISLACLGVTLGTILSFLLPAQFCALSLDNGWPLTFYVSGGFGIVAWILWSFFVYNSPRQHPRISHTEKDYLATSTGINGGTQERPPFPWGKGLSSPAVLAIVYAQATNAWFLFTTLISLPMYLREILDFDIKQNGMWLIMPYLLTVLLSLPSGYLADTLIKRNICSVYVTRLIFQLTASWVSSALLILVAFVDQNQRYLAVGLLTAINPIQALCRSGFVANSIDIAPRYSGEISSLSNTLSMVSGILAPLVVGSLTTNGTKREWQTVFFIASGIFISGGVVYMLFAKGTVLPWADSAIAHGQNFEVESIAASNSTLVRSTYSRSQDNEHNDVKPEQRVNGVPSDLALPASLARARELNLIITRF